MPDAGEAAKKPELTILDMFGVSLEFLTQVVKANPSLRGVIIGYLAERKLWERFEKDPRVTAIRKDDDHDRDNKGDLVVTYRGFDFRIEVKSLQTNSIKMLNAATGQWMPKIKKVPQPMKPGQKRAKHKWLQCDDYREVWQKNSTAAKYTGQVQCDASDRRPVKLPNGHVVQATNLVVGEFDILAVGLFAFREQWDFGFMLNSDLPRSTDPKYSPADQQYLLKTLIPVEWPLAANCSTEPFPLMDKLIAEWEKKAKKK